MRKVPPRDNGNDVEDGFALRLALQVRRATAPLLPMTFGCLRHKISHSLHRLDFAFQRRLRTRMSLSAGVVDDGAMVVQYDQSAEAAI